MTICKCCGQDRDWINEIFEDDDPDFMFEDLRLSQPGLIDLSGMPDPFDEAMIERVGKTLQ